MAIEETLKLVQTALDLVNPSKLVEEKEEDTTPKILMDCRSNIISGDTLKFIQKETLKKLADYLSPTYGPMGSYTQIITGTDQDNTFAKYSKDGLTVLSKTLFNKPIEISIKSEVEEICRYVENRVGDGTTSAVLLSYYIFLWLIDIAKVYKLSPQVLMETFEQVVTNIQERIAKNGRPLELDDVYDICMVSTNGNETIAKDITDIYKKYGDDVDITVSISPSPNTFIKEYDGTMFDEGYSDPAFINNLEKNTADIHNAKVYLFDDPVDDPELIGLFEKILYDNIIVKVNNREDAVPTVIMCPRLSRDSTAMLGKIVEALYQYDKDNVTQQKPQVLVISNYLGAGEGVAYDIGKLCGCKGIKKYINPEIEKAEKEAGNAPTLETVHNFAGEAELVSADASKTKFINPKASTENPNIYTGLINFLENEIVVAKERMEEELYIGRIKERLKRLKANNVEYFVGGIAISDRDSLRDLVIDAVKNCRSAAKHGVGYAANFEGLRSAADSVRLYDMVDKYTDSVSVKEAIAAGIFDAYYTVSMLLYETVEPDENKVRELIKLSIANGQPYNVRALNKNGGQERVLCSIETDREILEAVKRIIGLMASSNQCILPSVAVNTY